MIPSEFGKGLVICLVKFAEHAERLRADLDRYAKMRVASKNPEYCTDKRAVEMWANGASDHLYEIEVPEGEDWKEIKDKVDELKEKGLKMGHGFTGQKVTVKKAEDLMKLTREIALMIDKKLGLKPELGEW